MERCPRPSSERSGEQGGMGRRSEPSGKGPGRACGAPAFRDAPKTGGPGAKNRSKRPPNTFKTTRSDAVRRGPRGRIPDRDRRDRESGRRLAKDRMDPTGARWRMECAEAVLKLRSPKTGGRMDKRLEFHFQREKERNHPFSWGEKV